MFDIGIVIDCGCYERGATMLCKKVSKKDLPAWKIAVGMADFLRHMSGPASAPHFRSCSLILRCCLGC